jgi:hypothetical protein
MAPSPGWKRVWLCHAVSGYNVRIYIRYTLQIAMSMGELYIYRNMGKWWLTWLTSGFGGTLFSNKPMCGWCYKALNCCGTPNCTFFLPQVIFALYFSILVSSWCWNSNPVSPNFGSEKQAHLPNLLPCLHPTFQLPELPGSSPHTSIFL